MKTSGNGNGRESFPVVIRRGSVTVRIFREKAPTTKSGFRFLVTWHVGGERRRKSFQDLRRAKAEANAVANELASGEAASLALSGHDRLVYQRAVKALDGTGVHLDDAARQFADAFAKLGGRPISDAVDYFIRRHPVELKPVMVPELVREYLAAKQEQGMSTRYIEDLRSRCGAFAQDFQCAIGAVTAAEVREWLNRRKLSPRSWNNFAGAIKTLLNFARTRGYLPKDHDEMDGLEERKIPRGEIHIYTPDEMAKLLRAASNDFLPAVAIGGFAGLRSQEIERLDWADVSLPERFIKVSATKSKTGSRRLAPLTENLAAWLAPYAKRTGPVWPHSHSFYYECQKTTARRADVEWKANALRHSFISYRLAELKDTARVALEAGNSPQMVFAHYLELVRPADATRWFSLLPEQPENVVRAASAEE